MTEREATADLYARGVWRMAPGLWCDRSVPDFISVADEQDSALGVRAALKRAGVLPELSRTLSKDQGE